MGTMSFSYPPEINNIIVTAVLAVVLVAVAVILAGIACVVALSTARRTVSSIPRIIWTYWNSDTNVPEIVHLCMASWNKHMPNFTTILLRPSNLSAYKVCDVKSIAWSDKPAHEADIVRLDVLTKYGGIWMDATVFLNARLPFPLDGSWDLEAYFLSKATELPDFPVVETWCMACPQGSLMMAMWRDAFILDRKLFTSTKAAIQHLRKHGVNTQRIFDPDYLFINVCQQAVVQLSLPKSFSRKRLWLLEGEHTPTAPFAYLSKFDWDPDKSLNALADGDTFYMYPVIKFHNRARDSMTPRVLQLMKDSVKS